MFFFFSFFYLFFLDRLKDGMVFNLSVGLQGVPLSEDERKGSGAANMEAFSMVIAGQLVGWLVSWLVSWLVG